MVVVDEMYSIHSYSDFSIGNKNIDSNKQYLSSFQYLMIYFYHIAHIEIMGKERLRSHSKSI